MNTGQELSRARQFLSKGIWQLHDAQLPRWKALLFNGLKVLMLALQGYRRDNCPYRAASLTFFSLLSVVPVAAMAFAVSKGFGFSAMLEKQLLDKFPGQEQVVGQIIQYSEGLLASVRGGLVTGVGVVLLFWSVIKILGHIEESLNAIWHTPQGRSLGRKFADYMAIMLIGPVLVILSGSATVFVTTRVAEFTASVQLLGYIGPLIFFLLRLLPYMLVWVLFSIVYFLMPNTRVRLASGLLAGIVAGTSYQILQWVYISFQIGASKYSAIYGSFAALPLFMVWMQLSWQIVLFGAEIAYAHQNLGELEPAPGSDEMSWTLRERVALAIAHLIVRNFAVGGRPFGAPAVAEKLGLPLRLTEQMLQQLRCCGIINQVISDNAAAVAYQPARSIDALSVWSVVNALQNCGRNDLHMKSERDNDAFGELQADLRKTLECSPANKLLRDI